MPSAVEMSCFMDKVHLVSVGTFFLQYQRRCSQLCCPGPHRIRRAALYVVLPPPCEPETY